MFPELFRIGEFEVTTFGVLVALGALVGIWIFARELRRSDLPEDTLNGALGGVIDRLAGAKLIWTIEFAHTAPWTDSSSAVAGSVGSWGRGLRKPENQKNAPTRAFL